MGGYSQVDDWNPFGGAFLLLMLFALTYTFVCKYSAHRSEEVTSKAPNLYLQVCAGNTLKLDSILSLFKCARIRTFSLSMMNHHTLGVAHLNRDKIESNLSDD